MTNIEEKLIKACNFAVSKGKIIRKTSWSSSYSFAKNGDPPLVLCPVEINPILAVLFFIYPIEEKTAYNRGWHWFSQSDGCHDFTNLTPTKYWENYNEELDDVAKFLDVDKAWICGFIAGWFYPPRKNKIVSTDISIIPNSHRESFKTGFKCAKDFRPKINKIDINRPKIKTKTLNFIKWSLKQGLKQNEIKTIVDEALTELIISE